MIVLYIKTFLKKGMIKYNIYFNISNLFKMKLKFLYSYNYI